MFFFTKYFLGIRRFPFNQNVRFEFSTTSISEWNNIFQNFQKEDNLARYTPIFETIFPEVFFPFHFAPGISRIFGYMLRVSEIQQFSEFLEPFRAISVPFAAVSIFFEVLVEWKVSIISIRIGRRFVPKEGLFFIYMGIPVGSRFG